MQGHKGRMAKVLFAPTRNVCLSQGTKILSIMPSREQLLHLAQAFLVVDVGGLPRDKEAHAKAQPVDMFDPFNTRMTCLKVLKVVVPNLGGLVWRLIVEKIKVERR